MKPGTTRYFSWLNQTIFWKNHIITKQSFDDKRIISCADHKQSRGEKPIVLRPVTPRSSRKILSK